jgi:hypothetical protein
MPLALRIGRSRSIWEDGSDEEIAKKEFRGKAEPFDVRPSVYVVEPDDILRAVAEHVVQPRPSIQKEADELDLMGLAPYEHSTGHRFFDFTNQRHAELVLDTQEAVLSLVRALRQSPARRRRRNLSAIEQFIIGQLHQNDLEWAAFMSSRQDWQAELKRWLRPRGQGAG